MYTSFLKRVAFRQPIPTTAATSGWEVLIDRAKSNLLHCDCPWGGELLKIRVDAPAPWRSRPRIVDLAAMSYGGCSMGMAMAVS